MVAFLIFTHYNSLKASESVSTPKIGELKVSVKTCPILIDDIRNIRGLALLNSFNGVGGSTAVGIVTGVSPEESEFSIDDFVLINGKGVWSHEAVVSKSLTSKIQKMSFEDAASIPLYCSAWAMLNNYRQLKSGDVIAVGDDGSAQTDAVKALAQAMGYKVKVLSKTHVEDAKFVTAAKSSASVKLVITSEYGRIAHQMMKVLADDGALVIFQNKSVESAVTTVDIPLTGTIFHGIDVFGFNFQTWSSSHGTDYQSSVAFITELIQSKKLSPLSSKIFPLSDYNQAIKLADNTSSLSILKF